MDKNKVVNRVVGLLTKIITISVVIGCAEAQPQKRHVEDGYTTIKPMVHDPVMALENGIYYLYATGMGISCMSSTDLTEWTYIGGCIDSLPQWVKGELPEAQMHLWAPDIIYRDGLWHLYYACSAFGKNTSVIGHLTSKTLNPKSKDFGWQDCGMIVRSVPNRDNWNAIDPNVVIDDKGTPWMSFGSFWDGIKLVRMTDDMNSLKQPEEWYNIAKRPRSQGLEDVDPGDGAIEAPFIFRKGGWYYLFVSFDYCCRGKDSTYKVVVGRSRNVQGPYIDKDGRRMDDGGGSLVIEGDKVLWQAVGHCAAYSFDENDIFISHAYMMEDGKPLLLIRGITWQDDWPTLCDFGTE